MKISVNQGCMRIARPPAVLTTANLGSCIALALHDSAAQIGALLHIKLARRYGDDADSAAGSLAECTMYVSTAIPLAIDLLERYGAARGRMAAKIAGGARMFMPDSSDFDIGTNNITAAKEALERYAIRLSGEDTGGSRGRSVEFDIASGRLTVFPAQEPPLIL